MTITKRCAAALLGLLAAVGVENAATGAVQTTNVDSILTVTKAGSGLGTVTSDVGGINCGGTCDGTYANGTLITLIATPATNHQFTGWLGPCTGTSTCKVTIGGATTALATFAPTSRGTPRLDIDGTRSYDALTDGLLVIRYLFGLSGASLITGAVGPNATRTTDVQIGSYLTDIKPALDVDGNGQADALSDGLMLLRYLFGLHGSSLIAGAVGTGATRVTSGDIETQIHSLLSAFPPLPLTWTATPLDAAISSMAIAPDGTGLFFGFPLSGVSRLAIRPAGGPIGAPQALPVGMSTPSVLGFAPNGDALLAYGFYLAFRPAGPASIVGTPQTLPAGYRSLKSMAITTTGAALVATDDSFASNGTARVYPRPAGAAAVADAANAQAFASATPGSYATLIGLVLDPDGGAVAVLYSGGAGLVQAVRASGQTLFQTPTPIANPAGLDAEQYRVVFAKAPDGHAVLAWIGSTIPTPIAHNRLVAAHRAPGGAFGAPQVVAATAIFDFNTVSAAIAAAGDGMLVWAQPVFQHSTCNDYQARASVLNAGSFGNPFALGPGTFPNTSVPLAIDGAGSRVAVAVQINDLGGGAEPCNSSDDSSQISVQTYKSGAGGLALEDNHVVATSQPAAGPFSFFNPGLSPVGLRLGASGTLAIGTAIDTGVLVSTLNVRE